MSKIYISSVHRKTVYFFAAFYLIYFGSLGLFFLKPSLFYYRAWEYYDELGYRVPKHSKWVADETGDQSRSFIFSFKKRWQTVVSIDDEGYRSVPFRANPFPVLIFGDSHTWGSGLSDEETIPWQVALHMSTPVFNGGRLPFTLSKMINNPRLKGAKIIVELVAQHLVQDKIFAEDLFDSEEYEIYNKEKKFKNVFQVHPKRYFIPLKILRNFSLTRYINEFKRSKVDSYNIAYNKKYTYSLPDEDLEIAIDNICKRSEMLKALGYQYVIALIPSKVLQLTYKVNSRDIYQEEKLAKMLNQNNVDYIDFCSLFRQSDAKSYYIPTDSHISPLGSQVIAQTIAHHLMENYSYLLPGA